MSQGRQFILNTKTSLSFVPICRVSFHNCPLLYNFIAIVYNISSRENAHVNAVKWQERIRTVKWHPSEFESPISDLIF